MDRSKPQVFASDFVATAFRMLLRIASTSTTRDGTMKLATVRDRKKQMIQRFYEAGGVVDFVFVECDEPEDDVSEEATHRRAVLTGMQTLQQRWDDHVDERVSRKGNPDEAKSKYFQFRIDSEKSRMIRGKQINHREFIGPRYDFKRGGLIVRGKGSFLNEFFFYSDAPASENIIPPYGIDYGVGTGFAYAFSSPPHSIGFDALTLGNLFEEFLTRVIGGVDRKSLIFQWPTDWTSYFDRGDEWWGSFLWSVTHPYSPQIAVIAASSTE